MRTPGVHASQQKQMALHSIVTRGSTDRREMPGDKARFISRGLATPVGDYPFRDVEIATAPVGCLAMTAGGFHARRVGTAGGD
jgi:hypothetical protein